MVATNLESRNPQMLSPHSVLHLGTDLREVYDYWIELCNGRDMPLWSEWDWFQLSRDIVPWCSVADPVKNPDDFVYRFWGTARMQMHGRDYTHRSVLSMQPQSEYANAIDEYKFVEKNGTPLYIVRDGVGKSSGRIYEILRVPFGQRGAVSQILSVGTSFQDDFPDTLDIFSCLLKPRALK